MSDASTPDHPVSQHRDSPCLPLCEPVPRYLAKQYLGPPYPPPQNTASEYQATRHPSPPPAPARRTALPNIVKLTATALLVLLATLLVRPLGRLLTSARLAARRLRHRT